MYKSLFSLPLLGLAATVSAANHKTCAPTPPATCYPADCTPCHCLGPENYGVNAPVGPKTCNGDFFVNIAGFYWNAHQDGMAYAIRNSVESPGTFPAPSVAEVQTLNNLIDARYENPNFQWDFGFKVGVGYTTTCDGWDIGVLWTWYRGRANDTIEANDDDNQTLLPLWSAFAPEIGSVLYLSEIETHWKLQMNLIDIELGRQFWTSKYLSVRPHIGLRIAYLDQDFDLRYKGGSLSQTQPSLSDTTELQNDFKGVGIRGGLNSEWNLGCGWAFYGDLAASIVYGRFSIDADETNRLTSDNHSRSDVLETKDSFRASRGMLDLALGLQWSTMFCDCSYGLTARLGWEHHLFFHQNQMYKVVRIGDDNSGLINRRNNTGENVFDQSRGNLDTQGWTLSFKFEF